MKKTTELPTNMFTVAPGVWGRRDAIVNYFIIQNLEDDSWVLVDAGLKWSDTKIKEMAAYLFGEESKPAAIVLTHGHFDHVGAVEKLADEWEVPVYAHHLEIPYLTGQSNYPPPDPTVGGGLMSTMAFVYPKKPINIWRHIKVLPANGNIPPLSGWRYIHTPGHSPGHISLVRENDSVLIAGDAFVTTKQESVMSVIMQTKVVSGPPKYFTYDWQAAKKSVTDLVNMHPKTAATGHGHPMRGLELQTALKNLASHFSENAIPHKGRYVNSPAITNANGVVYIPPANRTINSVAWELFGLTTLFVLGLVWSGNKKKKRKIFNENLLEIEYNF